MRMDALLFFTSICMCVQIVAIPILGENMWKHVKILIECWWVFTCVHIVFEVSIIAFFHRIGENMWKLTARRALIDKWLWIKTVPKRYTKIAAEWMVIPQNMVIGFDPFPNECKWWSRHQKYHTKGHCLIFFFVFLSTILWPIIDGLHNHIYSRWKYQCSHMYPLVI